ncbi:MAG TPA: hypothetical protein VIL32_00335 [Steroidobacteraceae bacterium]
MRGAVARNRWVALLVCLIASSLATSTQARMTGALPLSAQVFSAIPVPAPASLSTPRKMAATFESARQQVRQVEKALRRR